MRWRRPPAKLRADRQRLSVHVAMAARQCAMPLEYFPFRYRDPLTVKWMSFRHPRF
jgi:hypothetical protein